MDAPPFFVPIPVVALVHDVTGSGHSLQVGGALEASINGEYCPVLFTDRDLAIRQAEKRGLQGAKLYVLKTYSAVVKHLQREMENGRQRVVFDLPEMPGSAVKFVFPIPQVIDWIRQSA